jgi:hypothetical protein
VTTTPVRGNFLDRARSGAVAFMVIAGLLAIAGTFLDWVTLTLPDTIPADQRGRAVPFSGMDTTDGPLVLIGGSVLLLAALALYTRRRSIWAWLGFLASVAIGAIAIADYRAIGDITSDLSREMDVIGDPSPGIGITLVAVAALIGLISSLAGVAASPGPRKAG